METSYRYLLYELSWCRAIAFAIALHTVRQSAAILGPIHRSHTEPVQNAAPTGCHGSFLPRTKDEWSVKER